MKKRYCVNVMMDDNLHTKLMLISYVQKYRLGNKKASMSEIINQAVIEYFENHKEEYSEPIKMIQELWGKEL